MPKPGAPPFRGGGPSFGGPCSGELSCGKWMGVTSKVAGSRPGRRPARGDGFRSAPRSDPTTPAPSPAGLGGRPVRFGARPSPPPKIVTWLILPVVICLFQGLSHACLRITALQESAHGSLHQTQSAAKMLRSPQNWITWRNAKLIHEFTMDVLRQCGHLHGGRSEASCE